MDDDRLPAQARTEMTLVPHESSVVRRNATSAQTLPMFNHGAHHESQAEHNLNNTVSLFHVERRCGMKWAQNAEHVRHNIKYGM